MTVTLAIDAMGGDAAPQVVIDGLALVLKTFPDAIFHVFGNQTQIQPLLDQHSILIPKVIIHHTQEVIMGETKPSDAIRGLKNSSMRLAIHAVAQGQADGVVSAGNTGAYMALTKILLKTLHEIDRPVIVGSVPTEKGPCVLLDMGANVEASSAVLIQFAVIGEAYARLVLGIENPAVGLLNIGSEELKGRAELREAREILEGSNIIKNFKGFVEGDGIFAGHVHVVVTDGFTGNVVLKTIEGTAKLYKKFMLDTFSGTWRARVGYWLGRSTFTALRDRLDPRFYNGAPFLGLRGVAVKSHGGTDSVGFASAVRVAIQIIQNKLNDRVLEQLAYLDHFYSGTDLLGLNPFNSSKC